MTKATTKLIGGDEQQIFYFPTIEQMVHKALIILVLLGFMDWQ